MAKQLKVVIVDDKQSITDLFESYIIILELDVDLKIFNDSRKALEYVKVNPLDVLITDFNMPIVNGIDIIEAAPRTAARIMISGYISGVAEDRLTSLKAVFFEKPVPMKAIGKILLDKANEDE